MEKEETQYECYAIEFMKIPIGDEHCVFVPFKTFEGVHDTEVDIVIDKNGNVFDNIESAEVLSTNTPRVAGMILRKERLARIYPGMGEAEAYEEFLNESKKSLHIGVYDQEQMRFRHIYMEYGDLLKAADRQTIPSILEGELNSDSKFIPAGEPSPDVVYEDILMIEINKVKDLMKCKTFSEMKAATRNLVDMTEMYAPYLIDVPKDEFDEEEDEIDSATVEEELPVDMTDPLQVFGFDINKLETEIKKQVINQDDAIEKIVSAIAMDQFATRTFDRERILLCGPTGTGKTQIIRSLCELIDRPFVIVPTTQLTSAGYVGADIEDYFRELIRAAGGDVKLAEEQGVMYFEELDKNAAESGRNNDVAFKAVLNLLLTVMEDNVYDVPQERGKGHSGANIRFRTGKLTIIAGGSFEHIMSKKQLSRPIGFSSEIKQVDSLPEITTKDFKDGGVPTELIARFPIIVWTNPHTIDSLKEILSTSALSPLLAEEEKLKKIGVELMWDEYFITACAEAALKLESGARSLKAIVEGALGKAKREAARNLGQYSGIHLNEQSIEDPLSTLMINRDGHLCTLSEVLVGKQKIKRKV